MRKRLISALIAAKKANVSLDVVKKGTCRYEYDDRKGIYELKFTDGDHDDDRDDADDDRDENDND